MSKYNTNKFRKHYKGNVKKKVNNNQINHRGGKYSYVNANEYYNMNRVSNISVIDSITDEALNIYRPKPINRNLTNYMNKTRAGILDPIERNNRTSNTSNIEMMLSSGNSDLIINNIVVKKASLEYEEKNINNILENNLKEDLFLQFNRDISKYKTDPANANYGALIFDNIGINGDIPKDSNKFMEFSDSMVEFMKTENKELYGSYDEKNIKESLKLCTGWKNVNLMLHGVGTLDSIIDYVLNVINDQDTPNIVPEFMSPIFKIYIDARAKDMMGTLRLKSAYTIARENKYIVYQSGVGPITNITASDTLVIKPATPPTAPLGNYILGTIYNALKYLQEKTTDSGDSRYKVAVESLVVFMFAIVNIMKVQLEATLEAFKILAKDNKKQVESMKANVNEISQLFQESMKKYFGMKDYPTTGTNDIDAKLVVNGGILRVIGGISKIDNKHNLQMGRYPIIFTNGMELDIPATKKKLKDLIFSQGTRAVGGFILSDNISIPSFTIFRRYYERLRDTKMNNINVITKIVERIRKGVHIKDIKAMRNMFEKKYKEIIDQKEKTFADIKGQMVAKYLGNEYKKLRKNELVNLITLNNYHLFMKSQKNKVINDESAVELFAERDGALIKYSHYQLKASIFRRISIDFYKLMSNRSGNKLSMDYIGLIEKAYSDTDDFLLNSYLGSVPKDQQEHIKNVFMNPTGYTGETAIANIRVPSNNKPSSSGKSVSASASSSSTKALSKANSKSRDIGARDKKKIGTLDFWVEIRKKLGGLTVYIPFVDTGILNTSVQHGLLDVINAAQYGEIRESLIPHQDDTVIFGAGMNKKTISRKIAARGYIVVGDTDVDVQTESKWRCMLRSDINRMKSLSSVDLRNKLFTLISETYTYIAQTPYIWPKESETKRRLLEYCRLTYSTDDYLNCAILSSRSNIVKKLSGSSLLVSK